LTLASVSRRPIESGQSFFNGGISSEAQTLKNADKFGLLSISRGDTGNRSQGINMMNLTEGD
jgi:hypothetical protein